MTRRLSRRRPTGAFAPYSRRRRIELLEDRVLLHTGAGLSDVELAVFRSGKWYFADQAETFNFGVATDTPVVGDWDGDGDHDAGVFRNGFWHFDLDDKGGNAEATLHFGSAGDKPVVGDWDGDGDDDPAVFRNGKWFFDFNGSGGPAEAVLQFGIAGDVPVAGDWDGDGDDDIGVYRDGLWFFDLDDSGGAGESTFNLGGNGSAPVVGDWDGNGTDNAGAFDAGVFTLQGQAVVSYGQAGDIGLAGHFTSVSHDGPALNEQVAVFQNGNWHFDLDAEGGGAEQSYPFGLGNDLPLSGDWDGDGLDEAAVFRIGKWFFDLDQSGGTSEASITFGTAGDVPVAGDWDSDGDDDAGVLRNGTWFFDLDDAGGAAEAMLLFGSSGDKPVVGDWDGDGDDDVGVFRDGAWLFDLDDAGGASEQAAFFGSAATVPVSGDWDGNGVDDLGTFASGVFSLNVAGTTLQIDFGGDTSMPVAGRFAAQDPASSPQPLPISAPPILPPGGWDPGLRQRCVRYAGGEEIILVDCNSDGFWRVGVHSENPQNWSVGPGPAGKSFQVNVDPQVSLDFLPNPDGSYTADMVLDFINYPHPDGEGYFTWYSFADHLIQGGKNHPTMDRAFSHHTVTYNDSVLPNTQSAARLLLGGLAGVGPRRWLIEINLATNSWGDAHPSEKYVWNPAAETFGFDYVTLNGAAWGYSVQKNQETTLDINWAWLYQQVTADWEAGVIEHWSVPDGGWSEADLVTAEMAVEVKNRGIAHLKQSDYTLSRADNVGFWESSASSGLQRQEVSFTEAGRKLYLAGGGTAHQVYDPATDVWSNVAPLPQNLDHIQSVAANGRIYYIGGLSAFPGPASSEVYVYDPASDSFTTAAPMPAGRARGAGGVAEFDGMIYYAGGLHDGQAVPWFDVYDVAADKWAQLPDLPTARDHFHAAVANGKFYAIGGRNRQIDATTGANEAFDFAIGTWTAGLAPLPTKRGGFAAATFGDEVLIIGGEGGGRAYNVVEAYNTTSDTWRTLAPMPTGRHGIQAALLGGAIYVAAGGAVQGAGNAIDTLEVLFPDPPPPPISFAKSTLDGATLAQPTSLQFGPDGRLYVAQQSGVIDVYTVSRNGPNDYSVVADETITVIQSIPNHNDDGTLNTSLTDRLVTGLLVTGTPGEPVIYASSSDPRIGGGSGGEDLNLDTNSGVLSRLTWNGSEWVKLDLVRGLPRSEEQHSGNGLQIIPETNTLLLAMGGNTNMGAPSNNFALLPEFALSAAILSIDLDAIGETTYDLPTLDDEDRPGTADAADPFGGNNGKNQAMLVPGGPVQIYAPGFRNPYDLVFTQDGRLYSIDNGPNAGWGGVPTGEGPEGNATNDVSEPGVTLPDGLHFVRGPGYYAGHPNPTRSNMSNTFNGSNPQSPVSVGNPIESDFRAPLLEDGALTTFPSSTNGMAEFTASNFGNGMDGDLLAASFDNTIYRLKPASDGGRLLLKEALFNSVGVLPLDVTTQGDDGAFPGTIWVADYLMGIIVFEPSEFEGGSACTGAYDAALDDDGDGYHNADEMDNSTNACSPADVPRDWDADFTSNLNDPDDDNDGLPDTSDPFAIDPNNGMASTLPFHLTWENDASSPGGLVNLGFTGLMTGGVTNYADLYDTANMTAGGAAGVMTIDAIPAGDALGALNDQQYAFQVGAAVNQSTGAFFVHTRILAPFAGQTPEAGQSMGLFIGTGDQDNYLKIVVSADQSGTGIDVVKEIGGTVSAGAQADLVLPGPEAVDLYLRVDPATLTVQPGYTVTSGGVTSVRSDLGTAELVPTGWLDGSMALAMGIIATSRGASPFPVTWDFLEADFDPTALTESLLTALAMDQAG